MIKRISTAVLVVLLGVGVMTMIVAFTACSTPTQPNIKPRFSGDHTTEQIRGMWYICFQTRRSHMAAVPQQFHAGHCDCVIDKSREKFSSSSYEGLETDNLTRVFTKLNIDCQMADMEPIKIDPASI